jgi:hypothetical protein
MNAPLVCATGPPGNADAGLQDRRREKLTGLNGAYHGPELVQNGIIWKRWEREAARLFREFWRTGNQKHLGAFVRHIAAMRVYGGPR